MKVLVIQQKMIGDVLASTVICRAIKTKNPDWEVHYMVYPNTLAVIENNPFIDKIIVFDPKQHNNFWKLIAFGKKLKTEDYDAVIDVYGKWESMIPAYFSGAKIRIGHKKSYTSLFYTKPVKTTPNIESAAIYNRLEFAKALIGEMIPIDFPKIYLKEEEIQKAKSALQNRIDSSKKTLMIGVLGSSSDKSLPAEEMAKMLDFMALSGDCQMLFNFMPNQESQAKAIFDLCKPETQTQIIFDFYTKGLRDFLAVLSQCDALIGNEGGAVNMAKALEIPTFAIFSPWIRKESWSDSSDKKHVAVHLKDFHPEIYNGKSPKEFKNQSSELYKKLKFDLFKDKLKKFIG
ncbi:MAG: glycosyltransferase family 9 protein [Flavobacteriaceae bacterium]